jgi:hypothetical protein
MHILGFQDVHSLTEIAVIVYFLSTRKSEIWYNLPFFPAGLSSPLARKQNIAYLAAGHC